jgi:hypothetical protein
MALATYLQLSISTRTSAATRAEKRRTSKHARLDYIIRLLTQSSFGAWDSSEIAVFNPERWLSNSSSREIEFNSDAGPVHSFGAGPRGCYGIKQAYMHLRIIFTLIVWNFELQPTPEALSSFAVLGK